MFRYGLSILIPLMLWSATAPAAVRVFACEPEWAALALAIGGDEVQVYTATHAHQDPHFITARPSLIAKLRRADLLLCTGAELEAGWLPLLLRQSANRKVMPAQPGHLMAADVVETLDIPQRVDRAEGDIHAEGNPHLHLDPARLLKVGEVLAGRLQKLAPARAGEIERRWRDFASRWRDAMQRWRQQGASLKGLRVVSHHKDWRYLTGWLGLEEVAFLEPKPGIAPSPAYLAELKAQLESRPARVVLRTPYQDARPSRWLAARTGMKELVLPYTVGGDEEAGDLFALFDRTLELLRGVE